jgi:hypothetical protein
MLYLKKFNESYKSGDFSKKELEDQLFYLKIELEDIKKDIESIENDIKEIDKIELNKQLSSMPDNIHDLNDTQLNHVLNDYSIRRKYINQLKFIIYQSVYDYYSISTNSIESNKDDSLKEIKLILRYYKSLYYSNKLSIEGSDSTYVYNIIYKNEKDALPSRQNNRLYIYVLESGVQRKEKIVDTIEEAIEYILEEELSAYQSSFKKNIDDIKSKSKITAKINPNVKANPE